MFLFSIFRKIGSIFKKIAVSLAKVFTSPQAQAALQIIVDQILPKAKPIVAKIRAIIRDPGNATVQEILEVYEHFGAVAGDILDNPEAKGHALLDLATELLRVVIPERFSTPMVHSAIELALSAIRADEEEG